MPPFRASPQHADLFPDFAEFLAVDQSGDLYWPVLADRDSQGHSHYGATSMSKSQDSKKAVKKEPLKTPKEKKEAKKLKKEATKRQ
jgi:hypothetical protein